MLCIAEPVEGVAVFSIALPAAAVSGAVSFASACAASSEPGS
jgi:hypothetical protein